MGIVAEKAKKVTVYLSQEITAKSLLAQIKSETSPGEDDVSLAIPNNTEAAKQYFIFATSPENDPDWVNHSWSHEIAKVAVEKYDEEKGEELGVPIEKVAFEIRVHATPYHDLRPGDEIGKRVAVTNGSLHSEGFFQWLIDLLYNIGVR